MDNNKVEAIEANDRKLGSLEDEAGAVSRLFMIYMNSLFNLGSRKILQIDDLGSCPSIDQSGYLYNRFDTEWKRECIKKPKKPSLWNVLVRTVGFWRFNFAMALYLVYAGSGFGPILILSSLTRHFEGVERLPVSEVWILVALLFVVPMIGSIAYAQSSVIFAHIAVQFRNVMIAALYRKALVLGPSARQQTSTGQIVNMFSTDTKQLQNLMQFYSNIYASPPQIIVSLALIYLQVGNATWVGLALLLAFMPFNGIIFGKLAALRRLKM